MQKTSDNSNIMALDQDIRNHYVISHLSLSFLVPLESSSLQSRGMLNRVLSLRRPSSQCPSFLCSQRYNNTAS